jgi:hypothetical protein
VSEAPATVARRGRGAAALALVGLLVVAYSLGLRAVERGAEYPGWDLIGPAHGLHLLSTRSALEAVREVLASVRGFQYWTSKDSLVYCLVPGALSRLWPWQHWVHLLTLGLFALSLGLAARAAELPARDLWLLLLAWGASPALLSFSIAGPFISACLPHALALVLVTAPGLRGRPLASLALALAVAEVSWHLYPTGRTVFVVFLLAAAFESRAPGRTRLAWLAAAVVQAALVLRFSGQTENEMLAVETLAGRDPFGAGMDLVAALLDQLDVPVLWLLGLLGFVFFQKRRGLLLGLFLGHLGLLWLLSLHGADKLLTRRFLLVDFYALLSLASAFVAAAGRRPLLRRLIVLSLLAGNLWQLVDLQRFYARRRETLPYVQARGDYIVQPPHVALAEEVRRWVDSGGVALLGHNLSAYLENSTDPAAVLERLYVGLGHERFVASVLVFGSERCRYDCLPIRPLESAPSTLEDLRSGRAAQSRAPLRLYYPREERSPKALSGVVLEATRSRFLVRPAADEIGAFRAARLDPALDSREAFRLQPLAAGYARLRGPSERRPAPELLRFPLDLAWLPGVAGSGRYVSSGPFGSYAFSLRWRATFTACATRDYELLTGFVGDARVRVDGREVRRSRDYYFRLHSRRLPLGAGPHALEVEFATWLGLPRLLLDVRAAPDAWAPTDARVCAPAATPEQRAQAVVIQSAS